MVKKRNVEHDVKFWARPIRYILRLKNIASTVNLRKLEYRL